MSAQTTATPEQNAATLLERFTEVRRFSEDIAAPLSPEDSCIQSMPGVSPTRWHLAHTTWFFETFLLKPHGPYEVFDESFEYLFNSYYNTVGEQFPRHRRGLISRPGLQATLDYRNHVDQRVRELISQDELTKNERDILEIGLQHEQQHQELMLTDIKHVLFCNPLWPAYQTTPSVLDESKPHRLAWQHCEQQVTSIGYEGRGFHFDNEGPKHEVLIQDHEIASRCVTNGEYLEFVEDGGYNTPTLWLSMGWGTVQSEHWCHPLYWRQENGQWFEFTLQGRRELDLNTPLSHISYFEADAFARWAGRRLPTEFEWEHQEAVSQYDAEDNFADHLLNAKQLHPQAESTAFGNLLGNVWEWTASPYIAYPGYQALDGALGEYNGKFMCNQFVLRGGSVATSSTHIRATYRNFFPPEARWQFSGIRLAK